MTVGQKIRFFRDLRGYTQAELGEMVGLPGDRIRQYETNVRTPKLDKLREIADALDVDVAAISYVDIGDDEHIMQIIFELEDQYRGRSPPLALLRRIFPPGIPLCRSSSRTQTLLHPLP